MYKETYKNLMDVAIKIYNDDDKKSVFLNWLFDTSITIQEFDVFKDFKEHIIKYTYEMQCALPKYNNTGNRINAWLYNEEDYYRALDLYNRNYVYGESVYFIEFLIILCAIDILRLGIVKYKNKTNFVINSKNIIGFNNYEERGTIRNNVYKLVNGEYDATTFEKCEKVKFFILDEYAIESHLKSIDHFSIIRMIPDNCVL